MVTVPVESTSALRARSIRIEISLRSTCLLAFTFRQSHDRPSQYVDTVAVAACRKVGTFSLGVFADRLEAAAARFLPFLQSSDLSISASLLVCCRALRLSSDVAIITQSRHFHCTVSMHVQTGPKPQSFVPKFPTPATHSPESDNVPAVAADCIGVRSVLVPEIAARGERWIIHLEMSLPISRNK